MMRSRFKAYWTGVCWGSLATLSTLAACSPEHGQDNSSEAAPAEARNGPPDGDLKQILADFADNKIKARRTYGGQRLRLEGTLGQIFGTELNKQISISVLANNAPGVLPGDFQVNPQDEDFLSTLKPGDTVTFDCVVSKEETGLPKFEECASVSR